MEENSQRLEENRRERDLGNERNWVKERDAMNMNKKNELVLKLRSAATHKVQRSQKHRNQTEERAILREIGVLALKPARGFSGEVAGEEMRRGLAL